MVSYNMTNFSSQMIEYGAIMNTIDLHGLNLDEARQKMEQGLVSALNSNEWVVRIIHGQGKHSQFFPVIKSFVRRWVTESDFAAQYIEMVYRGEEGSPYSGINPGEIIVILKGCRDHPSDHEFDFDPQEEREIRQQKKGIRADRLRKSRRRASWR